MFYVFEILKLAIAKTKHRGFECIVCNTDKDIISHFQICKHPTDAQINMHNTKNPKKSVQKPNKIKAFKLYEMKNFKVANALAIRLAL